MMLPGRSPLMRHGPVRELSREDGPSREDDASAAVARRRREAGIQDRNQLTPAEAVAMVRAIRSKALRDSFPDSTALIRADRDGR